MVKVNSSKNESKLPIQLSMLRPKSSVNGRSLLIEIADPSDIPEEMIWEFVACIALFSHKANLALLCDEEDVDIEHVKYLVMKIIKDLGIYIPSQTREWN